MTPETPPILEKYLERTFMLATFEVWMRAEKTGKKAWTEKMQPCEPYMLAEWNGISTIAYYDKKGITWVKDELQTRTRKGDNFLEWILSESDASYDAMKALIPENFVFTREQLPGFFSRAVLAGSFLEAVWFLIELAEEGGDIHTVELDALLKARKYSEHLVPLIDESFQKTFESLYPDKKHFARYFMFEEVLRDSLPSDEVLKERQKSYLFFNDQLFTKTTTAELGAQYGFVVKKELFQNIVLNEITGKVAQPGLVRGKVCIIRKREDVLKCTKGDIIVSPTTTPDFLPAMIVCGGIIADEGGIVSHAAITSRELKKPCIIGTKIATQVLKDGDMVEVDADRGVVTILQRA